MKLAIIRPRESNEYYLLFAAVRKYHWNDSQMISKIVFRWRRKMSFADDIGNRELSYLRLSILVTSGYDMSYFCHNTLSTL